MAFQCHCNKLLMRQWKNYWHLLSVRNCCRLLPLKHFIVTTVIHSDIFTHQGTEIITLTSQNATKSAERKGKSSSFMSRECLLQSLGLERETREEVDLWGLCSIKILSNGPKIRCHIIALLFVRISMISIKFHLNASFTHKGKQKFCENCGPCLSLAAHKSNHKDSCNGSAFSEWERKTFLWHSLEHSTFLRDFPERSNALWILLG